MKVGELLFVVSEVVKYGLALICFVVMSLALMLFALLSFIN